jgi:membrane-bound lytic murein transglycosylase B
VLDALYTLGFFYPRREEFFRGELINLFALAKEENLDLATLKGSYAGAMGWGQFMPSSYRDYARDGDGDGRRDLLGSPKDAFASIANYFIGYGWQTGQPAFIPAVADAGAAPFVPEDFVARYSLADLAARGYRPRDAGAPNLPATLLTLEGANGPEYWIGYQNFYVITRYNRSPLYAMAVYQLSREIAAGASSAP